MIAVTNIDDSDALVRVGIIAIAKMNRLQNINFKLSMYSNPGEYETLVANLKL